MWGAFHLLLGQVSGDMGRAICGLDVEAHCRLLGIDDGGMRRLHYLGVLGMQNELKAWHRERQEQTSADPPGSG